MTQVEEVATVVILEPSRSWATVDLDSDTVMTLIALISDDPSSWEEALSLWPRYRTPAVCEFATALPLRETDRAEAIESLATCDAWVVIDFASKRVLVGGEFAAVTRDVAFAMSVDESGKQHAPLSIHLPPWWELHEGVALDAVDQPRTSPIDRPRVDREVLYGDPFLSDVADRVLEVVVGEAWRQSDARINEPARYQFTVAVHRDWLMTPRDDLDGRMPRSLLHGALQWSDRVTSSQQLRFEDGGSMIALPDDWNDYATAPMGSQEMCLYFDYCREIIDAAWLWCLGEAGDRTCPVDANAAAELTEFLRGVKNDWLYSSFEEGPAPSFIIECSRRRVPRGIGIAIEGIDTVQADAHVGDCDCPICQMMADGLFGVGFESIDGHHLELDEEFAFSMRATRDEWEEQQREFGEYSNEWEMEPEEPHEFREFESAWSGIRDEGPLPGDPSGHLKLAFMVAEIVSELEFSQAPRDQIQGLNEAFAAFRRSDNGRREAAGRAFKSNLQSLADRYPELVSQSADLQSRIDESLRSPTPQGE
ncbi:hypothetical protein [Rosistilla oblonga]|uniref:hypothetical protein n=1 Tax=Rosistilla oblonga TaxID=2527990 RepID=UPI003A972912